jgi:hypothetical protein
VTPVKWTPAAEGAAARERALESEADLPIATEEGAAAVIVIVMGVTLVIPIEIETVPATRI